MILICINNLAFVVDEIKSQEKLPYNNAHKYGLWQPTGWAECQEGLKVAPQRRVDKNVFAVWPVCLKGIRKCLMIINWDGTAKLELANIQFMFHMIT